LIYGEVTSDREAIVPIDIIGATETLTIEAVIDTGFTEYLCLPQHIIDQLDLNFVEVTQALLADGSIVDFDIYEAEANWGGHPKDVLVHSSQGGALIGMSLLYGCKVAIDVVDGGTVSIV